MALHWLFPTPVLQVYQHTEFSDRNNLTGDLLGHAGLDQLHRMDAFQWLNGQLAEHVSAYLRALLGLDHGLVALIQKAWPVECARNDGTVDPHSPRYSMSYDLAITTAPGKGREMRTPHPMDWVPFGS